MIQNILIGIGILYFLWSLRIFQQYNNDHANFVLKNGKKYAAKMEIISNLLKDREQVRDLLLDMGIIEWAKYETITPGEIVVIKRSLVVRSDSKIINTLLDRRKRLQEKETFNDMLYVLGNSGINDYLCRWPDYMNTERNNERI